MAAMARRGPQTQHAQQQQQALLQRQQQVSAAVAAGGGQMRSPRLDKTTKVGWWVGMCCCWSAAPGPALRTDTLALLSSAQAHIAKLLRNAVTRAWCRVHGKSLAPPKLPPVVLVSSLVGSGPEHPPRARRQLELCAAALPSSPISRSASSKSGLRWWTTMAAAHSSTTNCSQHCRWVPAGQPAVADGIRTLPTRTRVPHTRKQTNKQAARIPCDADSITEMIRLIDANRDGSISWSEFEGFMMTQFASGQKLLSGEFVLPSGAA
jgi:hypothetical protein